MFGFLRPSPTLTEQEVLRSLRHLVWESVASGVMFSLGSGGLMAAYALALGANNLQVGLLAALPFLSQVLQIPAILAVERFRRRKAMGISALLLSHLMWVPIGAVPWLLDTPGSAAVTAAILMMAVRGIFAPVWTTCWTSWVRDLVPREAMGAYHSRRQAYMTASIAVVGLAASFLVSWWEGRVPEEDAVLVYSFMLIGGVLVLGISSVFHASRISEPLMPAAFEESGSALSLLLEPWRDRNFSQLLRFLLLWNLVLFLAFPFFPVYMLTVLDLELPVVIAFTSLSLVTNVMFVSVWGSMADRFGSKTVMSLSASLYLLVILCWIVTGYPESRAITLALLAVLHVFMGIAAAGVTLTTGTIAFKVAPQGKSTPYLGAASIATYVGAGVGPVLGGLAADFFLVRSLELNLVWSSPNGLTQLPALSLSGYEFLFAIVFLCGLLTLNLLVALQEEGATDRYIALGQLVEGASPVARVIASTPFLGPAAAFSYAYIKRLPGADVAMGVSAYQLAASTRAAVTSVGRGRILVQEVAHAVGEAVEESMDDVGDFAEHGLELARHATRGAVHAGEDLADQMGRATRGAVLGTLRTLSERQVPLLDALHGAGYGVVEGALESCFSPGEATVEAVEAARQAARELGVSPEAADTALAAGMLEAAEAAGEEALLEVRDALPDEVAEMASQPASDAGPAEK